MEVTLTLPDDLATRLKPVADHLPRILELGLREWHTAAPFFEGLGDVLETLARLPSPEEVLALCPAPALQARLEKLLAKNRSPGLSDDERREWEQYPCAIAPGVSFVLKQAGPFYPDPGHNGKVSWMN